MNRQALGKLHESRHIRLLIVVSWFTWIALYIGKNNLAASIADIIQAEGYSRAQLGLAASAFFLTYGLGQMVSGVMGDRYCPSNLVFFGIFLSAGCNMAIGFAGSATMIIICCGLNGLVLSFVWPPMVRLFAELLSAAECARASVTMGTTAPVGVVVSYGLCALMLHFLGWRSCFWSAAIVLLGASFAWLAITKYLMRVATKEPDCAVKSQQTGGMPKHRLSYLIIASGLPLILGACFLHSVLKDGMQTWIPTYITERYDISSVFSLMLTMGLPFINLLGILLSKWWASAPNRNEMHLVAILFGFTAVAAICMSISGLTLVWALILLALITTAMMGANIIFINVLPTRFSNTGYVSTIAGITNSSAYVGGAAASVAYGSIADYYGWDTLCVLWCVIAVAGVVISLLGAKRWLKYRRMETNNE